MVQVFSPSPGAMQAGQIGQALGIGVGKNFPDPQQLVQRGLLEEAMGKLPQNASLIDTLKTIGPQLMTTPGGSQLLAELAPILQKQSTSQGYLDYLKQQQAQQPGIDAGSQMQPGIPGQGQLSNNQSGQEVRPEGAEYFKNPTPPVGKEGTYPKMSALPNPVPLLTPQEMRNKEQQLTASYLAQGMPADPVAIQNTIQNEQQQRMQFNQKIEEERGVREGKQLQQTNRIMERFDNSSIKPKSEEDKFIFEKFANEAKDAANENDQYQYAKAKYTQFDNARNGLIREAEVPGFIDRMFGKLSGTYKSKESVIKDIQPHIKRLKDLGLESQARSILSGDIGLGMEDTELALNPPTKDENKFYSSFPNNKSYKEGSFVEGGLRFPGEESSLPREEFVNFKEKIADYLTKNPEANIVSLRGILNADKKYAWTDVSKSLAELMDEGRFKPNPVQEQQWNVVKSAPMPGMGTLFKEFWRGTR